MRGGADISAVYDRIYTHRTNVWEDQGRTPEFIAFFSQLAVSYSNGSLLEIGCGEGFLLAAFRGVEKAAIDISIEALRKAATRAKADFAVALAERLPFPDGRFDLAVSVGVMEHFYDDDAATSEILRVLKPGGRYLALIHLGMSVRQRIAQKLREYVFPRPRPIDLARWLTTKAHRRRHQPIRRRYTITSARACLERNGFRVERVISKMSDPGVPLIGPHVRIYVAQK